VSGVGKERNTKGDATRGARKQSGVKSLPCSRKSRDAKALLEAVFVGGGSIGAGGLSATVETMSCTTWEARKEKRWNGE